MSATIEIQEDLFCEMIFSLLDKVDTKEQVDWLKNYGANFYDLKLYKYVENKHGISSGFFTDITTKFWDDAIQYKHLTWEALKEIITTNFYEKHLGLGFDCKQTVTDITFTMEEYGSDKAKRYYSATLLKSIAATHELVNEDLFSFTKAIMPNNDVCVVFKIVKAEQEYFYNITEMPI
jgi:hypothetical protein